MCITHQRPSGQHLLNHRGIHELLHHFGILHHLLLCLRHHLGKWIASSTAKHTSTAGRGGLGVDGGSRCIDRTQLSKFRLVLINKDLIAPLDRDVVYVIILIVLIFCGTFMIIPSILISFSHRAGLNSVPVPAPPSSVTWGWLAPVSDRSEPRLSAGCSSSAPLRRPTP